jgi:hypothetical protein
MYFVLVKDGQKRRPHTHTHTHTYHYGLFQKVFWIDENFDVGSLSRACLSIMQASQIE